ncbi:MAG: hypothetical protein FVQ82_17500 [Planctomycetes bacterium]|nr:hypothetical protein [Planctomycetota bacterium]
MRGVRAAGQLAKARRFTSRKVGATATEDALDEDVPAAASGRQIDRVRDVVVCATAQGDSVPSEEFRTHPPVGTTPRSLFENAVLEVDLGGGIALTRLSDEEAEHVMDACTPAGRNFTPVRQFGQRYSFVRKRNVEDVEDSLYAFDEDRKLRDAISLSRLIRDNGFSLQYAARVMDRADGEQVICYLLGAEDSAAYRLGPGREWLDGPEAEALASLLAAKWELDLPDRVSRALWRSEYATRIPWADVMLPTILGGLEALLKTGRGHLTEQFKKRTTAVASDVETEGIEEDLCARMYDGRSDWVHGSHVQLFGQGGGSPPTDEEARQALNDIAKMRDLLRVICRRAIEDPDFRAIFTDDKALEARWPA